MELSHRLFTWEPWKSAENGRFSRPSPRLKPRPTRLKPGPTPKSGPDTAKTGPDTPKIWPDTAKTWPDTPRIWPDTARTSSDTAKTGSDTAEFGPDTGEPDFGHRPTGNWGTKKAAAGNPGGFRVNGAINYCQVPENEPLMVMVFAGLSCSTHVLSNVPYMSLVTELRVTSTTPVGVFAISFTAKRIVAGPNVGTLVERDFAIALCHLIDRERHGAQTNWLEGGLPAVDHKVADAKGIVGNGPHRWFCRSGGRCRWC